MPYYETVLIARQDMTETQVKDLTTQLSKVITDNKGKVHKTESWGLRKFAYKINKASKGHYVMLETDTPSEAIIEMERQMGLNEDIVRFMTIKNEELSKGPSVILQKERDYNDEKEAA
jgi:small subunit ribosomal protein S6